MTFVCAEGLELVDPRQKEKSETEWEAEGQDGVKGGDVSKR